MILCSCQPGGARRQRREALSEGPGGRGSCERPDGGAVMCRTLARQVAVQSARSLEE